MRVAEQPELGGDRRGQAYDPPLMAARVRVLRLDDGRQRLDRLVEHALEPVEALAQLRLRQQALRELLAQLARPFLDLALEPLLVLVPLAQQSGALERQPHRVLEDLEVDHGLDQVVRGAQA